MHGGRVPVYAGAGRRLIVSAALALDHIAHTYPVMSGILPKPDGGADGLGELAALVFVHHGGVVECVGH